MNRTHDAAWDDLQGLLESFGLTIEGVRSLNLNHGMAIHRFLSGNLGRIPLAPRWRVGEPMAESRAGEPVEMDLAQGVIDTIVGTWNLRLGRSRNQGGAALRQRSALLDAQLRDFIQRH